MVALFLTMEIPIEKTPPYAPKGDVARRNADSYFVTWEKRTNLVKQQVAADSAANDAKSARLRALRLAKEAADREAPGIRKEIPKRTPRRILSIKG